MKYRQILQQRVPSTSGGDSRPREVIGRTSKGWLGAKKAGVLGSGFIRPRQLISNGRTVFSKGRFFFVFLLLCAPSLISIIYYGIFAADRYVSETKFIVRTASKPILGTGFSAFLAMTGLSRAQEDIFSVQDYLTSRDAIRDLEESISLRAVYSHPNADMLAKFPSLLYGDSQEELYRYLSWMIHVHYSSKTGISTLRVEAFKPDDALSISQALLLQSEKVVNRMNERAREDAMRVAARDVQQSEARLVAAQLALTKFRNNELMIDAGGSSIVISEVIARLAGALTDAQTQLTQFMAGSPTNPQIEVLKRQIQAISSQIELEKSRISDPQTGLANKLAQFEQLTLEKEFAKNALAKANSALDGARTEARRQQLYLELIAMPNKPDFSTSPNRLRNIGTTFVLNFVALLLLWLFVSGIREHAAARI